MFVFSLHGGRDAADWPPASLDGFTLTGGGNTNNTNGGGALCRKGNGAGHACSPNLARLLFGGNRRCDDFDHPGNSRLATDVCAQSRQGQYLIAARRNHVLGNR